jgi:NhaP-type Na+/H+ or K+/H+ antiporter
MYLELAIVALITFGFALISGRVEKLPISGPIIFVLIGMVLGPLGGGWLKDDVGVFQYRALVDVTLALILFSDAANARTSVLRGNWGLPARMLGVGLPLAILLGTGLAWYMFDEFSIYEAAVLGTTLAATDAALGKAVVTNEAVPAHLREGLNAESGLNDGLCVPILLVFIALAGGISSAHGEIDPLMLVFEEIGIGLAVGAVVAGGGGWLLKQFAQRGWISSVWVQLAVPALALACFAVAQSVHGSGYIAAFSGGMLFGTIAKENTHKLCMPSEGLGEALAMTTWMIFGVGVIGQNMEYMSPEIVVYSLLSLTAIRMLPIFLSLAGSGESTANKLFLGWFGPRGLASIVFVIIVLGEKLPAGREIAVTVVCTVGLSLLLHGVSANPIASWLGKHQPGSQASH